MQQVKKFKLDPWVASSLLQKAIRRGATTDAINALRCLHRFRGKAVWRRLLTILFEDLGLAGAALSSELVFLACNPSARQAIGPDLSIACEFVSRMCESPKDRSSDYLECWIAGSQTTISLRKKIELLPTSAQVEVACDDGRSLRERAVASAIISNQAALGRSRKHRLPYEALICRLGDQLPKCWSAVDFELLSESWVSPLVPFVQLIAQTASMETTINDCRQPEIQRWNGTPLYAFDMHTSIGKKAIALLVCEEEAVKSALCDIPQAKKFSVACTAVFYSEGGLVDRELEYRPSKALKRLGANADMTSAGAELADTCKLITQFRNFLPVLNEKRLRLLR